MSCSMKLSSLFTRTCRGVNSSKVNPRFLHEKMWTADMGLVNETSIKNCLKELSIPFKEGYTCLQLKDCVCGENTTRDDQSTEFFINKRTGFFLCQNCKTTCDWMQYSTLLTRAKDEKVDVNNFKKYWERYDHGGDDWNGVAACTEPLKSFNDAAIAQILKEFKLPALGKAACEKLKLRINKEKTVLFFPLHSTNSVVVGYKTYDMNGNESTFPKVDCPGHIHYSLSTTTCAILVANVPDFLALASQNLRTHDIICLPYGSSHLPQSCLPFFEGYGKIVLWLGIGNVDSTGSFANKLIEKRCYVVRPIDNQVSASVAVEKKESVVEILKKAKLSWHQFVTTFHGLRDEILAELQNNYEASGVPWKRFPTLTNIMKGHRRGELTVLTGPTGVGKTTFLSEYSLDLAMQGVNTLWGSFELKNTRLAKIMLRQFLKGPIPDNMAEYNALCDQFEDLPIFFLTFQGQQELFNVMDAIKHCSYTYDIAHVIIDNVQFMIEVSPDSRQMDRFWKQDFMIQSFRTFASTYNCHVTLVMHPKKTEGVDLNVNSIFGGVKASQEADNILIIQKKDVSNFAVKKYLQVCKNRYSGDLGSFPLFFDKQSLSFAKQYKKAVETDASLYGQPEPWNKEDFREPEKSESQVY